MTSSLLSLSPTVLDALAARLTTLTSTDPLPTLMLQQITGSREPIDELKRLFDSGVNLRGLSEICALASTAAARASKQRDAWQLVLSGPEVVGIPTRATEAVVAELIESAKHSITFVSYSIYDGKTLFARLADRMSADPDLKVRLFLNVERPKNDTTIASDLVARFRERFLRHQWPSGARLPEVFYDPRSVLLTPGPRACLHAKCIIVDDSRILITSANLSEAAQVRNIEMGVLTEDPSIVARVASYLESSIKGCVFEAPRDARRRP